jgi:hypothetical protein
MAEIPILGGFSGYFDEVAATVVTAIGALFIPVIAAVGLVPHARRFGWSIVLRQAFRQPRFWMTWWPQALRHTGDVWDRLPARIRAARVRGGAMIAGAVVMANLLVVGVFRSALLLDETVLTLFLWLYLGIGLPLSGVFVWLEGRSRAWARAAGLTKLETNKLLSEPTWNAAFWSKPHIAALLEVETTSGRASPASLEPADLVRQIERLAEESSSSLHADVYRDARAAALTIQQAIARCDRDVVQLARDADPRERERIEASLAALGEASSDQSPAKRQMRELLARQLELFQEIEERREETSELRSHLVGQLRILALQLARLRSDDLNARASAEITEGIRQLVQEIEHRVQAASEVRRLLEGSGTPST